MKYRSTLFLYFPLFRYFEIFLSSKYILKYTEEPLCYKVVAGFDNFLLQFPFSPFIVMGLCTEDFRLIGFLLLIKFFLL